MLVTHDNVTRIEVPALQNAHVPQPRAETHHTVETSTDTACVIDEVRGDGNPEPSCSVHGVILF